MFSPYAKFAFKQQSCNRQYKIYVKYRSIIFMKTTNLKS